MLRHPKYACFGIQSTHASASKERMLGKSFAFAAIKGTLGSKEHWASTEQMLRNDRLKIHERLTFSELGIFASFTR
jgi:hypothetical protein